MDFYQYYDHCTISPSSPYDDSLPNFNQALELVGANHSFVDFKLDITEGEKSLFEQLSVNNFTRYEQSIYPPTTHVYEFQPKYAEYLKSIGNTDKHSSYAASSLARLLNSYMAQMHTNKTFIFGSSWAPTFFESPSFWHIDSDDKESDYLELRILITIKGPSTLICDLEENRRSEEMDIINQLDNVYRALEDKNSTIDEYIHTLNNASANLPPICSAENGHKIHQADQYLGTIIVAGKTEFSTIHSGPTMTTERIFFSMTGSKPL